MDPIRNRVLPIVGGAAIVAVVAVAVADREDATARTSTDLCTRLACTAAQSDAVGKHASAFCSSRQTRIATFRAAMEPLRSELEQAPIAQATVAAAVDADRAHREAEVVAAFAAVVQIHAELDARQRGVLAEAVAQGGAVAVLACPVSTAP